MMSCLNLSNCPKCQESDLTWHKTSKNKNWLKDEQGKWHNCTVMAKQKGRGPRLPKCKDCPWNFGHYSSQKQYEWHRKVYHPFNEVWTEKDIRYGRLMVVECRFWYQPDPDGYWKSYEKSKHL